MYMNSDIPCELFWPWKRVNLDPDEHPMPLTLTYLLARTNNKSKEVDKRSS